MTMTIEDLRDILNGFVDAGMGDVEFRAFISNHNYEACVLESANINKNTEGFLVPAFSGKLDNA